MREASFYELIDADPRVVQCHLCPHECRIKNGHRGICKVRENQDGTLISLVYGKIVSEHVDPIEKKPLFHVLPTSLSYSIATVGCNFHCQHCQNYEISQYPALHHGDIYGRERSAKNIVEKAIASRCASISYTYIEPTVFFEFAYDTAMLAHEKNLLNIFVSNGYISPKATKKIAPYLDANNIDLKAFTDSFYREVCGARLQPVLDTIALMKEEGVWVEVTTLIIPGWNDSDKELHDIANFLVKIDPNMPWHVTRFHPTFKMTDRPPTPVATLRRAREIGLNAGIKHVYTGNLPGEEGENTFCSGCGSRVIERSGFHAAPSGMTKGRCYACGETLPGIFS